jgi:hypothetical protein
MCLPDRAQISFVALFAAAILWTMALPAPSLGQTRAEATVQSDQPRAPATHHHRHVHGTLIVCDTSDVHSCHKEFVHRHRAQGH